MYFDPMGISDILCSIDLVYTKGRNYAGSCRPSQVGVNLSISQCKCHRKLVIIYCSLLIILVLTRDLLQGEIFEKKMSRWNPSFMLFLILSKGTRLDFSFFWPARRYFLIADDVLIKAGQYFVIGSISILQWATFRMDFPFTEATFSHVLAPIGSYLWIMNSLLQPFLATYSQQPSPQPLSACLFSLQSSIPSLQPILNFTQTSLNTINLSAKTQESIRLKYHQSSSFYLRSSHEVGILGRTESYAFLS